MEKTIKLMGMEITLIKSGDSDDNFTDWDIFTADGELIGNVVKYTEDKRWAVYSSEGNKLGERAELKAAVGMVARNWEGN